MEPTRVGNKIDDGRDFVDRGGFLQRRARRLYDQVCFERDDDEYELENDDEDGGWSALTRHSSWTLTAHMTCLKRRNTCVAWSSDSAPVMTTFPDENSKNVHVQAGGLNTQPGNRPGS